MRYKPLKTASSKNLKPSIYSCFLFILNVGVENCYPVWVKELSKDRSRMAGKNVLPGCEQGKYGVKTF